MQLEHSFTVPVGIDEAWRILLDIERIGPCMPGAVIESVDGDDFTGSVKVKLGPINLTYKGKASFIEKDETAHRAVIDARGRDARGNGTANAKVTATLADVDGTTKVDVLTDLDITGKPAQFGRGVMVDVGNKLIGQFADCVAATITAGDGGTDDPAPADSAPALDSAAALDPAPALYPATAFDPAAEPTPIAEEAAQAVASTPGYSAPTVTDDLGAPSEEPIVPASSAAAATTEEPVMNGRPSRPSPRPKPAAEVEPIDLLQSAGPAVAKRLAPVALAVVVLLIAVRRRQARTQLK